MRQVLPTTPETGHAVLWDGEKINDPGNGARVDLSYVDRHGLEFTQSAIDLEPTIAHERSLRASMGAVTVGELL